MCKVTASFFRLQLGFRERGLELLADCAADCWVYENVDVLNNVLCNVIMGLEKCRPGSLSLSTLTSLQGSDMCVDVNQGLALLLVLLQLHDCIEALHFEYRSVMGTDILNVLPAGISKSRTLKLLSLRISDCLPQGVGRWLMCTSVGSLVLDNVNISARDAEELSLFVDRCPRLEKMVLSLNQLDELSSWTVLTGLCQASHLTELTVKNNRLGVKSLQALSRTVKSSPVVASLTLWNCALTAEHLDPLSHALMGGCAIVKLDLSCNFRIGDEGIKCLSECLCKNQTLEELCLVGVGLSSGVGCASLGALLAVNTSITWLSLSENCIGDEGADSIAAGVRNNTALKVLVLESANVGADGVGVLADAVLTRSGVLTVKLGKVRLAGTESRRLALKLKNTKAREHVEVFWDSSSVADFVGVLKRCARMDELTVPDIGDEFSAEGGPNCFSILFKGLAATDNVRVLTITNANSIGDGEIFSQYLATAKTLQKLRFTYSSFSRSNDCFMAGLAENSSLREIHFGDTAVASSSALAEALLQNSTLEALKFYNFEVEELGMNRLIWCLKDNLNLVRFETGSGRIQPRFYFRLHELLKRNWNLLMCAVAFVLNGARDRASAEAFEGKRCSVELLAQLALLGMVSTEEARKMVRMAELRRRREFFSLAGVVRRDLRCLPAPCDKPQLDSLGDILYEIASYLSVSDVWDDLVPLNWTIPVRRHH